MHQQQSMEKTKRGRWWPCGFRHDSVQAGCIQCTCPKRWYHLLTEQDIPGTSVSVCSFIIHTRNLCSSVPCFSPIPNVHTGLNDQTCQESSKTLHAYLTKNTQSSMFAEHLLQEKRNVSWMRYTRTVGTIAVTVTIKGWHWDYSWPGILERSTSSHDHPPHDDRFRQDWFFSSRVWFTLWVSFALYTKRIEFHMVPVQTRMGRPE